MRQGGISCRRCTRASLWPPPLLRLRLPAPARQRRRRCHEQSRLGRRPTCRAWCPATVAGARRAGRRRAHCRAPHRRRHRHGRKPAWRRGHRRWTWRTRWRQARVRRRWAQPPPHPPARRRQAGRRQARAPRRPCHPAALARRAPRCAPRWSTWCHRCVQSTSLKMWMYRLAGFWRRAPWVVLHLRVCRACHDMM